jgi:hypothetical protein
MTNSSKKVLGYQGWDYKEIEKVVIVCPNPKCRYKHVDMWGDMGIFRNEPFTSSQTS